jgi:xanthine dehydrogenase YagR molybdenum-binding subunit
MNTSAMASFRAPGHVEGAFGLERAMDMLAVELRIDPLELRRRNYADHDQEKGRPYSAKHLDECYRQGAERFGWHESRERAPGSGRLRRGSGMASLIWGAGGGPPAYATVRINRDGSIEVLTGAQDLGTGARTVFSQIAAEVLGARIDDVRTILGDTERLPFASNSWGSITTASVGPAVRVAAEEARDSLFEAASQMLDADVGELVARDSEIRVRDNDRSITFAALCDRLGDVMIIGQGSRGPNPDNTAIAAFGAQFAEVEVDTETGHVRVLRIVSAHDSGRIINPTLAESQLEGGIIQGLGYALHEERVLDKRLGVQLNANMHDYKIPTMADIPVIDAFFVRGSDTVANHTGAKGLAEPPIIATAPAIANAVAHALGREVSEIPLTPWRLLSR